MDEREKEIKQLSNYIQKMPSLSTTVSKILEICNDPKTSPADLNLVISLDPVLMGKVMRLINSAYYGITTQITSLTKAIIMLGINTVKNLALSTAVLGKLYDQTQFNALNMEGFWRHSLGVAVISKHLAAHQQVDSKLLEEFFIAGLLHDIGKIPLNHVFPEKYLKAMAVSDRLEEPVFLSESRVFPVSHAKVGELIAKAWNLGPLIKDSIAFHHVPEEYEGPHKQMVFTVCVADFLASFLELGFSGNRYPKRPSEAVFGALGLTMSIIDDVEEVVASEIEKASVFLKTVT